MALDLPTTAKQVSQKAKVDVKRELAQSDPFVARSYLGAIISGISNRVFEFYAALVAVELESNPFTAVTNLVRWASVWGVTRLVGQTASGSIWVDASQTGVGSNVPLGTAMISSDGLDFSTQSAATLAIGSIAVSGQISHVGGVATVTVGSAHGLASNALVTITGATQAGYNLVDAVITVTGLLTFTYVVNVATVTPSTGTPLVGYSGATIPVNASDSGDASNLSADATLSFVTPIASVETSGLVTFGEVIDGLDIETDDALRSRLLDLIQNPVTPFNAANITAEAREISGVTRVFVEEKTPAIGQVTVYFMRDEDDTSIPTSPQVTEVKDQILLIKPADISDTDVIVTAPVAQTTNFVFSSITPDTTTMREAITANLTDYFKETPDVSVAVVEDAYRSVIFNTIDPATGLRITAFTLAGPTIPIDAQDETSYDSSPVTEGSFVAGTGYTAADTLTMSDGSVVTVNTVSTGFVVTFTVDSSLSRGADGGAALTATGGTGADDFTLTPLADNLVPSTDLLVQAGEIRILGTVTY
jgi:uncharacterized phage protein gp47/JayE